MSLKSVKIANEKLHLRLKLFCVAQNRSILTVVEDAITFYLDHKTVGKPNNERM